MGSKKRFGIEYDDDEAHERAPRDGAGARITQRHMVRPAEAEGAAPETPAVF